MLVLLSLFISATCSIISIEGTRFLEKKIFYNNLSGSTLKLTLFEKSNCTEKYAIFVEISFHCTTLCCNFTLKLENETLFCTYFNSPQFTHFKKLNDTIFLNWNFDAMNNWYSVPTTALVFFSWQLTRLFSIYLFECVCICFCYAPNELV